MKNDLHFSCMLLRRSRIHRSGPNSQVRNAQDEPGHAANDRLRLPPRLLLLLLDLYEDETTRIHAGLKWQPISACVMCFAIIGIGNEVH